MLKISLRVEECSKVGQVPPDQFQGLALHVAHTEILTDKEMISLLIQFSIPAAERGSLPLLSHGVC